jgi:hypothetical protein
MKGAGSRFAKYTQYKGMDTDVFISRALDTVAEEMTPDNTRTGLPFEIEYQNESNKEVPEHITMTVRAALRHWCDVQNFNNNLFDIARTTIKFGDCFFRKTTDLKTWQFIDPGDIIGITIDDDGNAEHYHVRGGEKNKLGAFGDVQLVPAAGIVHFSLTSKMGESGPFGESVLWACVKAYRHLTLLEDSVIIYRIVRAPERRVFFIDVGNMPPQRVKAYLDSIKNEVNQKRMPNEAGGTDKIDSVYNPISQTEDYYFAQTADGRGSRVETLPGGENLGQVDDLNYFQNKFLQGLRIPSSYMRGGADGGIAIADGKVGVAYIEELRFATYVTRLQRKLVDTFDKQFKCYLKSSGINVDPRIFKLALPDPQNFDDYKQAEVDEKMLGNYTNVKDDKTIATRMKQRRYLGWTEDDIQENEALLSQELGVPDDGVDEGLTKLRMLYDPKWIEGRPDIKVADSFDNHEAATAAPESEDTPAEEPEKPTDDESGSEDKGSEKSGKSSEKEEKPKDIDEIGDQIEKL